MGSDQPVCRVSRESVRAQGQTPCPQPGLIQASLVSGSDLLDRMSLLTLCRRQSLNPKSYTLHPTPYTLHPTPYTLHPMENITIGVWVSGSGVRDL
jgi:hypothetical protein